MSSHTVPTLLPDVLLDDPVPQEWGEIAARPDHRLLLEDREDPAQDQDGLHPVEPGPRGGEGAEILHHLEPRQRPGRQPHPHHPAVADGAAVGDGHLAADRHHPRILLDHPHQLLERALVEDRVGVERDEVGRGGGVDAGVQRVGLAAVLLVDDDEAHDAGRQRNGGLVHGPDPGGADGRPVGDVGPAEPERALEPVEGSVGRAVVHHHDLEPRIVAVDQAGDAVDDGHLLVVGRDDHRERLGEVALIDEVEVLDEVARHPAAHLPGRQRDQPEGVGVVEQEVQQKHRLHHQRENDERLSERLDHAEAPGRLTIASSRAPLTR